MSWLARLQALEGNCDFPKGELTKLTNAPSVSSVSPRPTQSGKLSGRDTSEKSVATGPIDAVLSRREAEARKYEATLLGWLSEHPPQDTNPNVCAGCGETLGETYVPLLDGTWVHVAEPCWRSHVDCRRAEAVKVLAKAGIVPPVGNAS